MTNLKNTISLLFLSLAIVSIGSLASITITRKKFLEDFSHMNGYYKQTLFLTGQSKREEAKQQYELLQGAYSEFNKKYASYKPFSIKNDAKFNDDLRSVQNIITSVKSDIYTGDLQQSHKRLEMVRPIFQEMFKRNGFSMLSMTLVDFHDVMEEVIAAADAKDSKKLLEAYIKADLALLAVEKEDNTDEIQIIRKNLEELKELAQSEKNDQLPAKAAELKTSFVKVYLKKG